ncbi:MAG TPA: tripartite tricarboxylate transporter substrate binding protein [Ramlibacter sp.]|nr:tripartite tricarboxylate transporter substrate binding protein [Ramlibacter sp.]
MINPSRIAIGFAGLLLAMSAMAQTPGRVIRIVNPGGPGGPGDQVARLIAPLMQQQLGTPVVVEGQLGAAGNIAAMAVVNASPDGHTLLLAPNGLLIDQVSKIKPPFDLTKDLRPVNLVAAGSMVLAVNSSQPFTTVQELIAHANSNPGKLNYAHAGGITSIFWENLKAKSGLKVVGIPYKGGGQMVTSILANETQLILYPADLLLPHVNAGKLRILMNGAKTRHPLLPNVPSAEEAGVRGYEAVLWMGLFAPGRTPDAVVGNIEAAASRALKDPEVRQKLKAAGFEPGGHGSADFQQRISSDLKSMRDLMQAANITKE